MMQNLTLALGIDPGCIPEPALAACAVLSFEETTGRIGVFRPAVSMSKSSLRDFLDADPLLSDPRLRLACLAAPLTPRPLPRKPLKARRIEIRLSRGAFAGSSRGPKMPWIANSTSWPRYQQALPLLEILQARGFPLLTLPAEAPAAEQPPQATAEVFPKASLAVLAPREPLRSRPPVDHLLGQLDDWIFPRLFTAPEPPIVASLATLAPDLHFAPEVFGEARRIAGLRRPAPRREPLRAFVAAFQGVLALAGAACLVGAPGDEEGSLLLPSTWHPKWEEDWSHSPRSVAQLRRVPIRLDSATSVEQAVAALAAAEDADGPKMTGIVEADETYVGGKNTGVQGGPMVGGSKIAVFTLIQRDGEARSTVVEDVKAKTLKGIIRREVEGTAHIMTDQMQSYHGLGRAFAGHAEEKEAHRTGKKAPPKGGAKNSGIA